VSDSNCDHEDIGELVTKKIESMNLGHGITFGIVRLELFVELRLKLLVLLRLDRILFRVEN
jgi:hypothetical protein